MCGSLVEVENLPPGAVDEFPFEGFDPLNLGPVWLAVDVHVNIILSEMQHGSAKSNLLENTAAVD
jgi:hypothetical protein